MEYQKRLGELLQRTSDLLQEMEHLSGGSTENLSSDKLVLLKLLPSWSAYFIVVLLFCSFMQASYLKDYFKEKKLL
jgi:hypothetical protein